MDGILGPQPVEVFMRALTEHRLDRGKLKAGRKGLLLGYGCSLGSFHFRWLRRVVKTDWGSVQAERRWRTRPGKSKSEPRPVPALCHPEYRCKLRRTDRATRLADKESMSLLQIDRIASRRRFLQFMAASPLLADVGTPAFAQDISAPPRPPDPMTWAPRDSDNLISDPQEALDVFDFEPVAKKNLPPAHFGYMVTGTDDEVTLRANREGFLKFQLRPRRLVDVATIDMTTEILGATYDSPIVIAPTGSNRR
jgi:hypothetical protein